ncbi:MAG: hypothetical protein Q8L99_04290 [Polycyclovorans sp.]|nr:hypothetical protein [Polycyclovorans sp.]
MVIAPGCADISEGMIDLDEQGESEGVDKPQGARPAKADKVPACAKERPKGRYLSP